MKVTISPDFGFLVNEEEEGDDESTVEDDADVPVVCIFGVTPHSPSLLIPLLLAAGMKDRNAFVAKLYHPRIIVARRSILLMVDHSLMVS